MVVLLLILLQWSHADGGVCGNDRQLRMGDFLGGPDKGYTAPEIQKCLDHFDDVNNPKLKIGNDPNQCLQDCATRVGKSKCMKAVLEPLVVACRSGGYKCAKKGVCRIGVDDLLACKRKNNGDCSIEASTCMENCTPEAGSNCIKEDIDDFRHGRAICGSAAPAKPLIPDSQVKQIIDTRAQEISTTSSAPRSELAKSSIFYGDTPPTGEDSGGRNGSTSGAEDSDIKGTEQAQADNNGGNGHKNGNDSGGAQSTSSEMVSSTGGSGSSSSSGSSTGGSSLSFANFTGQGGGAVASTFSGSGSSGNRISTDAVGGSGPNRDENFGGESWGDTAATKSSSGNTSSSSSSGGVSGRPTVSGGGGLASPFANPNLNSSQQVATASKASSGRAGSLETSAFQSGFHKASATDKKGGKIPLARTNPSGQAAGKNQQARKGDGSMNLAKLLKNRLNRNVAYDIRQGPRSKYPADVGRGPHVVFRTINSYYEKVRLDMNGEIEN